MKIHGTSHSAPLFTEYLSLPQQIALMHQYITFLIVVFFFFFFPWVLLLTRCFSSRRYLRRLRLTCHLPLAGRAGRPFRTSSVVRLLLTVFHSTLWLLQNACYCVVILENASVSNLCICLFFFLSYACRAKPGSVDLPLLGRAGRADPLPQRTGPPARHHEPHREPRCRSRDLPSLLRF